IDLDVHVNIVARQPGRYLGTHGRRRKEQSSASQANGGAGRRRGHGYGSLRVGVRDSVSTKGCPCQLDKLARAMAGKKGWKLGKVDGTAAPRYCLPLMDPDELR